MRTPKNALLKNASKATSFELPIYLIVSEGLGVFEEENIHALSQTPFLAKAPCVDAFLHHYSLHKIGELAKSNFMRLLGTLCF